MGRLFRLCLIGSMMFSALTAQAQTPRDVNAFVFGNSLIHHLTDTPETTMPYWLAQLAEAGGHGLALDGQWGFLPQFAVNLPPEPNWTIDGVERVWANEGFAFRRVPFDTILISPANFVQYQGPDRPYDGDNPTGTSPLAAAGQIIDWSQTQARGARFFIYEGWAEMASVVNYPPNARGMRRYHAANQGEYHQWYLDLVAQLQAERPDIDITLIPVARVLAEVLSTAPFDEMRAEDLYLDDAPHGTGNLYFLAAMISYAALYGEAPPDEITLPESLHPVIRDNYLSLRAQIWASFSGAIVPASAIQLIPETGLTDPSLAMGLNGIADWSTQQPFVNVMKTARPWIGHISGQWGGWDMAQLVEGGFLNAQGWPVALPEDVDALEAFVLTDQPAGASSLAGRYVVTWRGEGDISVTGSVQDVERDAGRITFGYRPGEGLVAVRIEATDAENPIRDIAVVREDLLPFYEAGVIFNPDWVAKIADLRMIRFMDWMMTNGSPQVTFADRPMPDDFSYVWRGAPIEVMVELANQIGADPWFTVPHMADDAYNQAMALIVASALEPDLVAHVEWSNEVWNFIFPQAVWAREQALARWGDDAGDDAWMQYAGLRAAEVAAIWQRQFEARSDSLVSIVATHSGWLGLEESMLEAPLAVAEGLPPPHEAFDGYAITGYFGFEIGEDEMAETLHRWIEAGEAEARVTEMLRDGSFRELTDDIFPYHAQVANRYGFALHMYEGGTHVAGHGVQSQDDRLTAFYTNYNYTPEMAALYADLLAAWRANADGPFNAFVDVSAPSQFGSWGALRHLDDVNPRWSTLQGFNAVPFGGNRGAEAFAHGVTRVGSGRIEGTLHSDVLIGGEGDDAFYPGGGTNRINGGDGSDTVFLPGGPDDYQQGWDGDILILLGPSGITYATQVEQLEFDDAPGEGQAVAVLPE